MKKRFIIPILPFLVFALARFCHKQTDGFKVCKIVDNTLPQQLSINETGEFEHLLSQKFTYLARGRQCFAFISEDQTVVLKVLNNAYQSKIKWLKHVPLGWAEAKRERLEKKLENVSHSYQIAYDQLKEQTGIVCMHLNASDHFHKKVTLVDKLGIAHEIDLDKTGFILQKRVDLIYPKLLSYKMNGDLTGAKTAITSLLSLLEEKYEKGIDDSDPLLRTNFGFIGDQAIQIDVGAFSTSADRSLDKHKIEILRVTASLKAWLQKNYPELVPFTENEVNRLAAHDKF